MSGNDHVAGASEMLSGLAQTLPELRVSRGTTKPCLYARTPSGMPIIDELEPGLFVAAGGNGRMAKSADAVAELAVALATDGTWTEQLPRERFLAGAIG